MEWEPNDVAANGLAGTSLGWGVCLAKPEIQGATMLATAPVRRLPWLPSRLGIAEIFD
jgi:hypothetical protein